MRRTWFWFWLMALPLVIGGKTTTDAAEPASAGPARALTAMLEDMRFDAIAAADPMAEGSFIAALYIPDGPLLVVKARHPAVRSVAHRIDMCKFRDAYLDLQATPTPAGKFFVQDSGADGLVGDRDGGGSIDVVYEDGVRQTLFNGDPAAQGLTRSEYEAKLAAADVEYARLLRLLMQGRCGADAPAAEP